MASNIRILVPVDFSDQSVVALEQSYNLARLYDAIVHLVYVLRPAGAERVASVVGLTSQEKQQERKEEARKRLNELAEHIRTTIKVPVQTTVASGKVEQAIVEEARKLEATMIVMATTGKSAVQRFLSDSVAYDVVSSAPCPVITVRGKDHRNWCNNILLPLDLSNGTTQKVQRTIEVAKMFDGSAIHLASVVWATDPAIHERLEQQLQRVKEYVEAQDLECFGNLIRISKADDDIASTVLAFAKKIDADLITIMTRQESKNSRLFVGSAANEIIRNSLIPVMSIVPEDAA